MASPNSAKDKKLLDIWIGSLQTMTSGSVALAVKWVSIVSRCVLAVAEV